MITAKSAPSVMLNCMIYQNGPPVSAPPETRNSLVRKITWSISSSKRLMPKIDSKESTLSASVPPPPPWAKPIMGQPKSIPAISMRNLVILPKILFVFITYIFYIR